MQRTDIGAPKRRLGPFNYSKKAVDEIIEMTQVIPLFDTFDPEQLQVIAAHMQVVNLEEGKRLFSEGEESDYMYFIVSGRVGVYKLSLDGKLVPVSALSRGDSIGEMAMMDTFSRSATVIASTATTMLMLKRENFERILEVDPQAGIAFLKALTRVLCRHLRTTSGQYADARETAGAVT
jgi:CRP/FNR family cyclic AMP-dependent transcriptional regulator